MTGTVILITVGGIVIGLAIIGFLLFLIQRKLEVKLNKFKLLAVGSAIGIPVFAILHNVVYGVGILILGNDCWEAGDEAVIFMIALFVCPIGILVGVVGSKILGRNKVDKKRS